MHETPTGKSRWDILAVANLWLQHQCIKNLTAILEGAGTTIDKVVKVNVFLANMDDFAAMNEVYCTYWGDIKPSRT